RERLSGLAEVRAATSSTMRANLGSSADGTNTSRPWELMFRNRRRSSSAHDCMTFTNWLSSITMCATGARADHPIYFGFRQHSEKPIRANESAMDRAQLLFPLPVAP